MVGSPARRRMQRHGVPNRHAQVLHGGSLGWGARGIGRQRRAGEEDGMCYRLRRERGRVHDNEGSRCERARERRMRETPFAGMAGAVLLQVRAVLCQQPLREEQYARERIREQWIDYSTWPGHAMLIHVRIICDKHQRRLPAPLHHCKVAPSGARARRGCIQ